MSFLFLYCLDFVKVIIWQAKLFILLSLADCPIRILSSTLRKGWETAKKYTMWITKFVLGLHQNKYEDSSGYYRVFFKINFRKQFSDFYRSGYILSMLRVISHLWATYSFIANQITTCVRITENRWIPRCCECIRRKGHVLVLLCAYYNYCKKWMKLTNKNNVHISLLAYPLPLSIHVHVICNGITLCVRFDVQYR